MGSEQDYRIVAIAMDDPIYQQERELRNRVLMRPIGLPDFGWESKDKDAHHFVALLGEQVVACAMLCWRDMAPGEWQLMQMAVNGPQQRQGVGRHLIAVMVDFARKKKIRNIVCHARDDAVGFYKKMGFHVQGEPFEEVGIVHFRMSKPVQAFRE